MHTEYKITPDGRVVEYKSIPVFRLHGITTPTDDVYQAFSNWQNTPEGQFVNKHKIKQLEVHSYQEPMYFTYNVVFVATMPAESITEMYLKFPRN